jgi:hypothetical protein
MAPNEGELAKDFLARRKRSRASFWSYWFSVSVLLGTGGLWGWVIQTRTWDACPAAVFALLMGMLSLWGYGKERIQEHIGRELRTDEV